MKSEAINIQDIHSNLDIRGVNSLVQDNTGKSLRVSPQITIERFLNKISENQSIEDINEEIETRNGNSTEPDRLTDLKLSTFYEINKDVYLKKPKTSCKCKFSWFYVYSVLILGVTIFVSVSPKVAEIAVSAILRFCSRVGNLPTPVPSIIFLLIIYSHQFLGIPLQTASVMLITFSVKSFLHGYLLAVIANVSSSLVMYLLFKKWIRKRTEKSHKDNIIVTIIREESAKHPIRVSFIFRFMNIPALYKNVGLGLSPHIHLFWFIIPSLIEACLSNAFICFLGSVMEHGLDAINPKSIKNKSSNARALFIATYALLALQVLCIVAGVAMMMAKLKAIRDLRSKMAVDKWRESVKAKGYVHDMAEGEVGVEKRVEEGEREVEGKREEQGEGEREREEEAEVKIYDVQNSHTVDVSSHRDDINVVDFQMAREMRDQEASLTDLRCDTDRELITSRTLEESPNKVLYSPKKETTHHPKTSLVDKCSSLKFHFT